MQVSDSPRCDNVPGACSGADRWRPTEFRADPPARESGCAAPDTTPPARPRCSHHGRGGSRCALALRLELPTQLFRAAPHPVDEDRGDQPPSQLPKLHSSHRTVAREPEVRSETVQRAPRHGPLPTATQTVGYSALRELRKRGRGHPGCCSATFSAQLTQPASVVRLHPFLGESPLLVVPEDVHEIKHDPAAIWGKGADR